MEIKKMKEDFLYEQHGELFEEIDGGWTDGWMNG